MTKAVAKTCKHCGKKFKTTSVRRKYCSAVGCEKARRSTYMKKYMVKWKKKHPSYWRNPKQIEYLKRWRQLHPDYFTSWRKKHSRKNKNTQGVAR